MRRRRRKRATRLTTAGGTSLAGVLLLTLGPVNLGLPGGGPDPAAAVAVVSEAAALVKPVVELPIVAVPALEVPAGKVPAVKVPAVKVPAVKVPAVKAARSPAGRGPVAKLGPKAAVEAVRNVDPGPELTKKGLLKVASAASGRYVVATGRDKPEGAGEVVRYMVELEEGLPFDVGDFAADVHRILNAPGGWGKGGDKLRFVRVEDGPVRFRVALSSPDLTDRQCAPLRTYGKVSCFNGVRSVINARRWAHGSSTYEGNLDGYRNYVISHEVGHALGKGHVGCPAPGEPAPVMVQQTKSLEGCAANPWPFPARAEPEPVVAAG